MGGGEVAVSFLDTCNKTRGALSVEPWQYYYITAFLLAWKHIKISTNPNYGNIITMLTKEICQRTSNHYASSFQMKFDNHK